VNSAKTELQVQKELDKNRLLTSAPQGRGTTPYTETAKYQDMDLLRNRILKSFRRSCHNNSLRKNIPIVEFRKAETAVENLRGG